MLPVTTLVINVSSVALIWFGGRRIDDGEMQVGSLIAFLSYFMQILMAVLLVTIILVLLPRAAVCAERITEVMSTSPAITSPEHPMRPATVAGEISIESATFRYPGADRPVLQNVSLTVRPGTTTAVVGSTGSGKSTLISLICRLYDVSDGAVVVDGVDVRDYDTEQLWSAIGLVPQRGYLFSGTVRREPALREDRRDRRARCGRRCGWPPPTASSRRTPTGWTCPSPRVASTSPAASGNDSRSRAP